ncbi:MAG: peptide-methionine (S)-S-oxide reductase MsrA [Candidatus Dormibacteria bacterium]
MSDRREIATLGGGCFWCLDAAYREIKGVTHVVSGYAGGTVPNPTYAQVSTGRTGHAEVVQVEFDPEVISYDAILDVFWSIHDPTTKDRQGADSGTQYRSMILTSDDAQAAAARASAEAIQRSWANPVVTEIEPLTAFYPAEEYHQDYFARNPNQGYCQIVINPKLKKVRDHHAELLNAPLTA